MEGLTTEAKVGKILILVAIVLGVVNLAVITLAGSIGFMAFIPSWLVGGIVGIAIVKVIGLAIGVIAFRMAEDGNYSRAGILGIVAAVLPPLDLIMLIGGILCVISPEAKRG